MYLQYWLPSGLCTFSAFVLLFLYSYKFMKTTNISLSTIIKLNSLISDFEKCDISNVSKIASEVEKCSLPAVSEAWERFYFDIRKLFDSVIAPQPEGYFTYDDIFSHPAREKDVRLSWKLMPAISLISLLASPTILTLTGDYGDELMMRITIGASFLSLILIVSLFTVFYTQIKNRSDNAKYALFTLNRTLTSLLPTATESSHSALMLSATTKNTIAFQETADAISGKIEAFALEGITPVVSNAFDASIERCIKPSIEEMTMTLTDLSDEVIKRQDEEMRVLADSFSESLTETLQSRISRLAESIDGVNRSMVSVKDSLSLTVDELTSQLSDDRTVLQEAIANVSKSAESQQKIAECVFDLSASVAKTEDIVVRLDERDARIFGKMDEASEQTRDLQLQLKQQIDAYASDKNITYEAVMSMSEEIKSFVLASSAASAEVLNGAVERIKSASEDCAAQTALSVEDSVLSIRNAVGESVKGANDLIGETLAKAVASLNDTFAASLEQTNTSVAAAIEKTNLTVGETFVEYSEKLMSAFERSAAASEIVASDYEKMLVGLDEYSKEQYEKSTEAQMQLMSGMAEQMNKTLGGVGGEIYKAITDASVNTSEIVERLAATAEKIKAEYDFHFSRVDSQNQNMLNEMEMRMQAVLSRFSDEAGGIMDKLENSVTTAMGMFRNNTTELLQSLADEARSIGLYTKDLNLDVTDLSKTLRESVGLFSESMQQSTEKTFTQFDQGLADINARFANTIESIRESVENLPRAIKGE